ncbi:unnamed protein product [Caretta caretta]
MGKRVPPCPHRQERQVIKEFLMALIKEEKSRSSEAVTKPQENRGRRSNSFPLPTTTTNIIDLSWKQ